MYAALSALDDPHLEALQNDVMWDGARGWLDEMEKAGRRRVFEEGWDWSSSAKPRLVKNENVNVTEDAPSDSNSDPYMTDWWSQGGRDVSVTLSESVRARDLLSRASAEQQLFVVRP